MTADTFSHSSDQDSDIADSLHPMITEEHPEFMSFDEGAASLYHPPAHIAARIYNSRNYTRKTSAASSRRNSMTSHQSSRSGRSAHGGPYSTHVAQHLRRASIIESRRAKAADRNAHAEKVRLRAATNKAERRRPVDSEERAMAAQQAREKYLAQVRAKCAAEVQRSTRVAEEHRERLAAESVKMKEEIAERHAQAERRKALLEQSMRRPRTAQSSPDEPTLGPKKGYVWKPRSEDEAARIIQQAWKSRYRHSVVQGFLDLGLTVEAARNASFDEVGERLNQEDVLQRTMKMLRLFRLTQDLEDQTQEITAVKTFLSIFLILGQPEQVLNKDSDEEKDVISKSSELLVRLEQCLSPSQHRGSDPEIQSLTVAYSNFKKAFNSWRSQDSAFMISNMVAQFVELDAIWQSVKDDTAAEVAEDYKEGIRHIQTLILTRLKKLAGPERAMKLIREAIRKNRKAKAQKKDPVDHKPRTISQAPRETLSSSLSAVESLSAASSEATSPSVHEAAKASLQSTSLMPESRRIVHEVAINKQWMMQLDESHTRREESTKGIANLLQEGLDAGLAELWIPALAESLLEKFGKIITTSKETLTLFKDVLDPELVGQQVKNGTFSYRKFFDFFNTMLPKLCAPVRDEDVKGLIENPSHDPVLQMARIYFTVELMVLDMANFQLLNLAPYLYKEAASYEASKFEELAGGQLPERTYQWWKRSSAVVHEEASRRQVEGASPSAANRVTANKIYMQGLVDLVASPVGVETYQLPETLSLDSERFARMQSVLLRMITTSSILLTAKNLLRRDTRSLWKAEAARMWDIPYTSASAFVSTVESRYALPPTTKQQLTAFVTRILTEAKEGSCNHPVMKVLMKKIKAHLLARLSASSAEERSRLSSSATEALGSAGMIECVARVGDMIQELARVGEVDREAHGKWYDSIVERLAHENGSRAD